MSNFNASGSGQIGISSFELKEQAAQKRADKKFLELMSNFECNRLNGQLDKLN